MAKRIQRRRTKGWRMPEGAIYVGRPTQWGNPFSTYKPGSHYAAVEMFRHDVEKAMVFRPYDYLAWIAPLKGKDLACWCDLGVWCHADVLLELANP